MSLIDEIKGRNVNVRVYREEDTFKTVWTSNKEDDNKFLVHYNKASLIASEIEREGIYAESLGRIIKTLKVWEDTSLKLSLEDGIVMEEGIGVRIKDKD